MQRRRLKTPLRCHASPAPPPSATIIRCALSRRALRFSGQGGFAIADFAAVASAMKVATATPAHASLAQEAVKATAGARAAASAAAQALAVASIPQAASVWVKEAATQKGGDAVALAQRQSGGNPFARGARAPHAPIPAPARRLGPCPEVSLPLEGAIPPRIPPLCVAACLRLVEMGCAVSREQPPRGITACTPSPHPQRGRCGRARARAPPERPRQGRGGTRRSERQAVAGGRWGAAVGAGRALGVRSPRPPGRPAMLTSCATFQFTAACARHGAVCLRHPQKLPRAS